VVKLQVSAVALGAASTSAAARRRSPGRCRIQARFGRTPSGAGLGIRAACAEQAAELNETQIEIAVATKCLLTE
jgi:hypothetical protein